MKSKAQQIPGVEAERPDDAHPGEALDAPAGAQAPAGGWPRDEYTGLGGEYVRDPATGERRPA